MRSCNNEVSSLKRGKPSKPTSTLVAFFIDLILDCDMELWNILLLLLLLTIPITHLCILKLILRAQPSITLPPGSTGFPFIGETLNYSSRLRLGCQYEFIKERMEKYSCKIFRTSLFGQPMAILCNAEGNKFIFSNENKLVKVWWPRTLEKLFPPPDNQGVGEVSQALRKIIVPLILKADVLREYLEIMDAVTKRHLETYWMSKDVVKVGEMARKYTSTLGCNVILGINDMKEIDEFVQGIDEIEAALFGIPINLPGTVLNGGIKAYKVMCSKMEAIIRQRKMDLSTLQSSTSSSVDLLSRLLLEFDDKDGQFGRVIASYLSGLILAGYTTLHGTITMVMKTLAENHVFYDSVLKEQKEIACLIESRDRLQWEDIRKMKYTWNVVCEVLRLYPVAIGGFREAITDFTYEGYTIPKGWKMHWTPQATHKNPKYFSDPGRFDPSRFDGDGPMPYTFVPFGAGSRMCPGNEYARLALLTFVHRMVTLFKWETLVPDEKILYYPHPRPVQGLPIRLYPSQSLN